MNIVSAVILCTIVGAVGAIVLVAASKFMAVEEDPRIEEAVSYTHLFCIGSIRKAELTVGGRLVHKGIQKFPQVFFRCIIQRSQDACLLYTSRCV